MNPNPANLSTTGLNPGDKLDKFEVLEQIGAGGMSVVWKGYDRLLDRHVAIKQLMPDPNLSDEDEFRERFRREAQIQKRVAAGHKHLVRIVDFIEEPRGLFIVMEYVDGLSLEQLIEQTGAPMDQRQALGIIGATAMALEAIHSKGVLHRDLKPSNILLPRMGGLKVCDFGLSQLMVDQETPSAGSVRYMAPELFSGDQVDGRADIYALGMIAYEMLAGRPQFNEAFKIILRDQRNQALRWMKWHTNPRTSAPPLSQLNPQVPATLSDLVARMMEKDPAKRVPTAKDLLEAIRRHFTGPPAAADSSQTGGSSRTGAKTQTGAASRPGVSATEVTAPLPRKTRLPYILAAFLAAQLVIGLSVWFTIHEHQQAEAQRQLYKEADDRFNRADELRAQEKYAEAKPIYDELAAKWPNHPKFGKFGPALSLYCSALMHFDAGDYETAVDEFDKLESLGVVKADKLRPKKEEAMHRVDVQHLFAKMEGLIKSSQFNEARFQLNKMRATTLYDDEEQRAVELSHRIEDQQQQAIVAEIIRHANDLVTQGQRARAMEGLQAALEKYSSRLIKERLGQLQMQDRHDATLADARAAEAAGDLTKAIASYTEAAKIAPDARIDDKVKQLQSRSAYEQGLALEQAGQMDAAAAAYSLALGFYENEKAREGLARIQNLDKKESYVKAGDDAFNAGNFDTALKHYDGALKLGADPAVEAKRAAAEIASQLQLATQLMQQGKFDESKAALEKVQSLDPENATANLIVANIARWKDYLGKRDKGDELRKDSDLGGALRAYRTAKAVINTEEIKQRINDAEYDSLMVQARSLIAADKWQAAYGLLKTAARTKETGEVKQLLADAEARLNKK